ncbi:hypothetical protein MWU60_08450 [Yoonia sp. F2084L]|uniref:hypothetical protein n=1 Tax=Yoonia sp. F2084L TaxID=2926419 RepID=UPI001FF15BE6|nr:hypothetical protein [Yoonia sp. F2084L]MCK0095600.1 hypothetical protein [Yoonia sp. F2084L]
MLNSKIIAILLALCGTAAVAQDSVQVPIDQAASIAAQALRGGDPALALQIAEAVLSQRPDDRTALIVVAAAAPQLGDAEKGRRAGARAWYLSQSDVQKYEAARLTALAATNEERFTLSTFWLRRALTVAPNEEERARTLKDARIVRQRNPLAFQVSGSLVPSNNINGGADEQSDAVVDTPFGETDETLSPDSLALEGWRASLSFGAQYRFQENQNSRTTAGLRSQLARAYVTDDVSIPDDAFDTAYYELSLTHDRALENGTVSVTASRGLFEYRDLDFDAWTTDYENYDIWRLGISRQFSVAERTLLSLSARREWLEYLEPGIGDVDRVNLTAGITHQLPSGDRVGATLSVTDSEGRDNANYTSRDHALGLNYGVAEPLGPVSISVGGGLRWSDYPDYRFGFTIPEGGRQDTTISSNINIGFPDISYAGFTPGLRIDASATESNVSRFDRTTVSVGLTITSQF